MSHMWIESYLYVTYVNRAVFSACHISVFFWHFTYVTRKIESVHTCDIKICQILMSHVWIESISFVVGTVQLHRVKLLDWFEAGLMSCCSVLQCVAVCCSVLQCVAVCCSMLQFVAVCCSVVWSRSNVLLQCVAVCCSVLQCVAVCYSVLQCGLKQV